LDSNFTYTSYLLCRGVSVITYACARKIINCQRYMSNSLFRPGKESDEFDATVDDRVEDIVVDKSKLRGVVDVADGEGPDLVVVV
jgi:hypothetical protein